MSYASTLLHDIPIGEPASSGTYTHLREPSGVTQLDATTLLVVEDEAHRALQRLDITSDNPSTFSFTAVAQPTAKGFIQRRLIAPLDDLEGIARVSSARFLVIGSHEAASRGKFPAREKILLMTRKGSDIVSARMRRDLYDQLSTHYPRLAKLDKSGKKDERRVLNIEAIAFDRKRRHLHIGLRTPLDGNDAIVITLYNAIDYLHGDEPKFADDLYTLDLDKGGIRAMVYDDPTDSLLIVSKRESGGKRRAHLWTLDPEFAEPPVRYHSEDRQLFDSVEGFTSVADGVLFLRDNGGKADKNRNDWFVLTRTQLAIED